MIKVTIEGLAGALKRLEAWPEAVEEALEKVANNVRERIIAATPVDSGTLKAGWGEVQKAGSWGQTGKHESGRTFSNPVPYGEILEEGLYPQVGKKTVQTEGGIFSKKAPGGIMGPLINDDNYTDYLVELFLKALEEVLEKKSR